jgi:predicted deacylase
LRLRILIIGLLLVSTALAQPQDEPVSIGTAKGVRGQSVRGVLKVAEAADGSPVSLPIAIVTGAKSGPVVWVQAAAHGDEYGGPRALQGVVKSLDPAQMSGTLVAVMVTNVPALQGLQRVNPNLDDLADFGSVFPGRERFATERIAAALTAEIRRVANHFIDMHTGGDRFRQLPFIFYTVTGKVPADRYDVLARGFGIPTLWRDSQRIFADDATTAFSDAGIPAFLLEVGGGQPLDPADVKMQADALRNYLRAAGVLPAGPPPALPRAIFTGYKIVTNARGGFFEALVKPGDRVRPGSSLGRIFDVWGDVVETLSVPSDAADAVVIGVSTYPAAATGGWLFELGTGLRKPEFNPGSP